MTFDWKLDELGFGVKFGSLAVSFQRFDVPRSGLLPARPTSFGALPVGQVEDSQFLLPLADDEAFWIGISSRNGAECSVRVSATLKSDAEADLSGGWKPVPPSLQIMGVLTNDHRLTALSRTGYGRVAGIGSIIIFVSVKSTDETEKGAIEIQTVDYPTFARLTGRRPPAELDPEASYKGHLLP